MENKKWIDVNTPDKWMTGWDNVISKLLNEPKENFQDLMFINYAVQVVGRLVQRKSKEKKTHFKALDLACGSGRTTCFLAKLGCQVHAVDALDSAVKVTKKRAEALGISANVTIEQKNIDGWEFKNDYYDIIIATQCLQYLFERAKPRLQEIANAIKTEGLVCYSGNIPPHFKTEPPLGFIYENDLKEIFNGWTIHVFGQDQRLIRLGDRRGYIWMVAEKTNDNQKK
jgi:2-polyprenyl-3-methyl-5-hydroxy-6-metoxy-1,4-benzoquinol methylase